LDPSGSHPVFNRPSWTSSLYENVRSPRVRRPGVDTSKGQPLSSSQPSKVMIWLLLFYRGVLGWEYHYSPDTLLKRESRGSGDRARSWPRAANKSAGRFASPLPVGRFLQPPDQCFLARRLPPLARNRSLVTAFRSPTTAAASRRPPFRGRSSQPATSLPPKSASVPVRPFDSTTASRFAPLAAASLPQARCTSTTRFGLPRLRSPLPSGTLTSLGIKAFNRLCCLPVHLTNSPDFLSLPAARPNESLGCGSPFQVRYVSASASFAYPSG
jgi:hypothetical protein